ncbi:MAG: SHOCT domain-containing protein [Actinomycetota bacterium]
MFEPPQDLRRQLGEIAQELGRVLEQAGRVAREAARDVGGWAGRGAVPPRPPGTSPVEAIRQLGELRDAGLITEQEFQAKKADLLSRI